jgi:hypothetical protein
VCGLERCLHRQVLRIPGWDLEQVECRSRH